MLNAEQDYKILWCNICKQDWVVLVKNIKNGQILLYCNEDFTFWDSLDSYYTGKNVLRDIDWVTPTYQEITDSGWEKYILTDEQIKNNDIYPNYNDMEQVEKKQDNFILKTIKGYISEFSRLFDYKGRSSRFEHLLIFIPYYFLLRMTYVSDSLLLLFVTFLLFFVYLPSAVRRLHDICRTGWLILIPFVNLIILWIVADQKDNKYGAVR